MKLTICTLLFVGFCMTMVQSAPAAEITHEQIEEVMKKGFKAKLQDDLAAKKEVLAKEWQAEAALGHIDVVDSVVERFS